MTVPESVPGLSAIQFSYVLTGLFLVLYGIESFRGGGRSRRTGRRPVRTDGGDDETPVSAHTVLLALTAVTVVASGTESPALVSPGEGIRHEMDNSPVLPMTVFVKGGDGVRVDRHEVALDRGGTANVSGSVAVPSSIGHHRFYVVEHRYVAVLPESVTRALDAGQPWLPVLGSDALVARPIRSGAGSSQPGRLGGADLT